MKPFIGKSPGIHMLPFLAALSLTGTPPDISDYANRGVTPRAEKTKQQWRRKNKNARRRVSSRLNRRKK